VFSQLACAARAPPYAMHHLLLKLRGKSDPVDEKFARCLAALGVGAAARRS
jgi:hypothetical protein